MLKARAKAGEKQAVRRVVIAGNPNAGKTTIFNALTKSKLKTGNWHGVTTSPAYKTVRRLEYCDVPGMYSFNAYSLEEDSAAQSIKSADVIINVVDALTLENSLNLTRQIVRMNKSTIIYVTKLKSLKARGGSINFSALEGMLGVRCVACTPARLRKMIEDGEYLNRPQKADKISFAEAYSGGNANLKKVEKLFYNKYFAFLFFVLALVFTFFITFHPLMIGARLKELFEQLICGGLANLLARAISNAALSSFVCEGLIGGVGGVLSFIPQITLLYLCLILLDESGIMSALSFVTDGIFERVNLSGRAAFSLVSGFGCTAAAIATTRGYAEESAQERTVAVLPFVPCGAKMPVFLTVLAPVFKNPFPAICILYFSGVALTLVAASLIRGKKEGLISEVAPVSLPQFSALKNKLFFYVKGFIIKVTTFVSLFCAVSWFLSHFSFGLEYVRVEDSMLCAFSRLIAYLFYPMGIRDWRVAYAALTGFAAKENVAATVAMLVPEGLNLAVAPSVAFCVFILTCPACVSAFAASAKEIGFKKTLKNNALQLIFSFLLSYLIYFLLYFL